VSTVPAEVTESIVQLIVRLVRTPSRAGIDHYEPIVALLEEWLTHHGMASVRMYDRDALVGLRCDLGDERRGPRYVLDACMDTAPFGDPSLWRLEPASGAIHNGWLFGRGSADSKAGVAIFCHVAAALRSHSADMAGALTLLLDADEHTGRFGGAKAYFDGIDQADTIAGVMIGYPGDDSVVIGSRGFFRAQITVHGKAAHSGSGSTGHVNAVERAAALVAALSRDPLEPADVDGFGLPPKLTVTAIQGGEGYSTVPDRCVVNVDVRLTPTFDAAAACAVLEKTVATLDRRWSTVPPCTIEAGASWPPYRLDGGSSLVASLREAVEEVSGTPPTLRVCGPSNIGNYLATLHIDATAGFGVAYRDAHGTDERIDLSTVPTVYAAYLSALERLLAVPTD